MIANPSETQAGQAPNLRGQIYRAGLGVGMAFALLVGGFSLAFGIEQLTAAGLAMGSFLVVGVLGWFADLTVGPALERVAEQREEERRALEREQAPAAGGILPAAMVLSGGFMVDGGTAAGPRVGFKGGALDVTLPQESVLDTAMASGAVAGVVGAVPSPAPVARPTGAISTSGVVGTTGAFGGGILGSAAPSGGTGAPGDEGFQDLASLLREASQPVMVPARQGR